MSLDHDSDSRAVAVVDWDQDGDLDLWYTNRTTPRVRYLQNNQPSSRYLAVRLQGVASNRDGIGARCELETIDDGQAATSTKTLRAGEGYLAQSSKWVHFGLGDAEPVSLKVYWPSGQQQVFTGLQANTRYHIKEGSEIQVLASSARNVHLAPGKLKPPTSDANLRVVPARRFPLPKLSLLDGQGNRFDLPTADSYRLFTLWATWCQPCIQELQELDAHASQLTDAGIQWIPLNVDDLGSSTFSTRATKAAALLKRIGFSGQSMFATSSAVECLDVVQRSLVTKQSPLPVPSSFLVDQSGGLMAVYKGNVRAAQVIADVSSLDRTVSDPRDVAIPFPGRWAMNAFPPDFMAIATGLISIGRTQESLDYLVNHIPTQGFQAPITAEQLTDAYMDIARDLSQRGVHADAERALRQALKVDEKFVQAHMALGELLLLTGRVAEAVGRYRTVLAMEPRQPMSLNNLAWLLASCADASLRNPDEAVRLAERLCQLTNFREPLSLDTLSVAYASDGQFDRAVEVVEKAIQLAKPRGISTKNMEARLGLFRDRRPFIDR